MTHSNAENQMNAYEESKNRMNGQKPVNGIYKSYNQETKKVSLIKIIDWQESDFSDGWQATVDPAFGDAEDVMFTDSNDKPFQHHGDETGFMWEAVGTFNEKRLVAVDTMEHCTIMSCCAPSF